MRKFLRKAWGFPWMILGAILMLLFVAVLAIGTLSFRRANLFVDMLEAAVYKIEAHRDR